MATKIFMTVMALTVPLMMAIIGAVFSKSAPKTINPLFGYRTTKSMKNMDTWTFAHHYCGRMWLVCGIVFAALVAALLAFSYQRDEKTFTILATALSFLCMIGMVWSVFLTERALKETFDENGERRAVESMEEMPVSLMEKEEIETVAISDDIDGDDFFEDSVEDRAEETVEDPADTVAEDSIFDE